MCSLEWLRLENVLNVIAGHRWFEECWFDCSASVSLPNLEYASPYYCNLCRKDPGSSIKPGSSFIYENLFDFSSTFSTCFLILFIFLFMFFDSGRIEFTKCVFFTVDAYFCFPWTFQVPAFKAIIDICTMYAL